MTPNQSELIAAYEFVGAALNRVADIGLLDPRLNKQAAMVETELYGLKRELLPLIGKTVVEDR